MGQKCNHSRDMEGRGGAGLEAGACELHSNRQSGDGWKRASRPKRNLITGSTLFQSQSSFDRLLHTQRSGLVGPQVLFPTRPSTDLVLPLMTIRVDSLIAMQLD